MKRPSKKQIKEALDKLKDGPMVASNPNPTPAPKLTNKMTTQRIRKQGVS